MKYVALLTGVNVGGKNKLPMADLKKLAIEIGFREPQTLLQTGNLVFSASDGNAQEHNLQLENALEQTLKIKSTSHIRTADDWEALVQNNPFASESELDPSHLVVHFLAHAVDNSSAECLQSAIRGREYFQAKGREVFIVYPDGIGDSKLTKTVIDSKLGQPGTARNWNTVTRLLDMLRT